jgi:hypothetical protein
MRKSLRKKAESKRLFRWDIPRNTTILFPGVFCYATTDDIAYKAGESALRPFGFAPLRTPQATKERSRSDPAAPDEV